MLELPTLPNTDILIGLGAILVLFGWLVWRTFRPRYFYIVRHGETLLNIKHIKQGANGALSDKGIAQATMVGKILAVHKIQKIYTSPYERAVQTAHIMADELHCPVEIEPLLRERRNASEVIGKRTDDPEVKRIGGLTAYGYHPDDYRYSDEENFLDLKERARQCLHRLQKVSQNRVVLVTHHAILHIMLSYITMGKELTANDYVRLAYFNPASNAGITLCVYHPFSFGRWEIRTYSQSANEFIKYSVEGIEE